MNLDRIQETYEKADDALGLRSKKMQQFLARREARRVFTTIGWTVTLLVLFVAVYLVKSATKVSEYLEAQVTTDTVYVEKIVQTIPDLCPSCGKALPNKVGKEPYFCPFCSKYLIRVDATGEIFTLEK